MKKDNSEIEDELRSEYDLKSLKVRKLGSERKSFGGFDKFLKFGSEKNEC